MRIRARGPHAEFELDLGFTHALLVEQSHRNDPPPDSFSDNQQPLRSSGYIDVSRGIQNKLCPTGTCASLQTYVLAVFVPGLQGFTGLSNVPVLNRDDANGDKVTRPCARPRAVSKMTHLLRPFHPLPLFEKVKKKLRMSNQASSSTLNKHLSVSSARATESSRGAKYAALGRTASGPTASLLAYLWLLTFFLILQCC